MRTAKHSLWLAVMLLSACQYLGLPTAETFNERLAVGYSSVTGIRQTAETLLVAKQITVDDAENVQALADDARSGLDIARTVSAVDPEAADARLSAILTILNELSAYLQTRETKP